METDEQLRARLIYVAGDGHMAIERIAHTYGQKLDDKAAEYNLKRRRL